jgi:anti-sigma B factor antagonist
MYRVIRQQGVTIIEAGSSGESLGEGTLEEFARTVLTEADQAVPPRLLIDLSQTDFIGSSFIELLVRAWKRVTMRGGEMAVCGVQPFCAEVLSITRLDTIWKIHSGRSEAIAALADR